MSIFNNIMNYISKVFLMAGYSKTLIELERMGYHKEYRLLAKKIRRIQKTI